MQVNALFWLAAVLAALYAVHRLALWMERRGWLYYRHTRGSSGSLGSAFLEVQALFEPGKRHVLEVVRDEDDEQDASGDPPADDTAPAQIRPAKSND